MPRPRPHCIRWGPSTPKKGDSSPPPIFGPCLLRPNGWMDQHALGMEVGHGPGHIVLWEPARLPRKGDTAPIFGVCLLWPNGWMDQDATWYKDRPRPRPHCVIWGPSSPSPRKGAQPLIFGSCLLCPNGWMDQHALGMEVGHGPATLC